LQEATTQEVLREAFALEGADVQYFPGLLSESEAAEIFAELSRMASWQRRPIRVRDRETGENKEVPEGRPTVSFSTPPGMKYRYSGSWRVAEAFPDLVLQVKQRVERLLAPHFEAWAARSGRALCFNYCLANKYETGLQAVGKHADDEKGILRCSPIAAVSLGAARDFVLEAKADPEVSLKVRLESGSVVVMAGHTQENFVHCITKDRRVKEPRISLTFRIMA